MAVAGEDIPFFRQAAEAQTLVGSPRVEYRYLTKAPDGQLCETVETARFNSHGLLERSHISITLPDPSQADQMLASAQETFGSSYLEGQVEGNTVTFTISTAGEGISKEAAEELKKKFEEVGAVIEIK